MRVTGPDFNLVTDALIVIATTGRVHPGPYDVALLCDRDGVLIEDLPAFVHSASEATLIGGAVDALARAADLGIAIAIVSNQSGIGRGLVSVEQAVTAHLDIIESLEQRGGRVERSYLCPHAPEDHCRCRKPAPLLLRLALANLGVPLSRAAFVGDAVSDIRAAKNAGVLPILVRTGRGTAQEIEALGDPRIRELDVVEDISAAVDLVATRFALLLSPATKPGIR